MSKGGGNPASFQKQKLLAELIERGWEQVDVDPAGVDWWACEHWLVRSTREAWGLELVITFQNIGELWETRANDPPTEIVATVEMPKPGEYRQDHIARCAYRNHFDDELPGFLDALDAYRRAPSTGSRSS